MTEQTGDLRVYVQNHNNTLITDGRAKVYLYKGGYTNLLSTKNTNASGYATFTNLTYDNDYNYLVYYNGTGIDEYWGYREGVEIDQSLETSNFRRDWPIFNGNPTYSTTTPVPGEQVNITMTVYNPYGGSDEMHVQVEWFIIKNAIHLYNHTEQTKIIDKERTKSFTFSYTPTSTGTYQLMAYVRTYSAGGGGQFVVTDVSPLQNAFTVTETQTGALRVYVSNHNNTLITDGRARVDDLSPEK